MPPLSVCGSTVVLFLNIGVCCAIFAINLHFKVICYLKFRWVFKWHFHSSAWVPPLVSDAAKDRKIGERKARAQQGKRPVRRQRVGGAIGSLHAWGKTWRGPEASGVGKSEATIHPSLRSLSQLLVSTYIKLGHTAGICAVTDHIWESVEHLGKCMSLPALCPATGP